MKILISNDDGIYSEGLRALNEALERIAEVWTVAPDREQSAVSHALSMGRTLRWKKVKELGPRFFAVNGTPTDCILLGVSKILPERPGLIVSGINKGENLGDDITYSGTVSAAIEGTILGIPSFAISLVARNDFDFTPAAHFAARLAKNILRHGLPRNTFLNVNVPATGKKPRAYKITRMGKRIYGDPVQEKLDRWGKKYYLIGGNDPGYADTEDSDFKAIANNFISITPLHLDWTNYASFETLAKRKI
ncbi:MAG: 5'/3'-nucleotidase SurE [Deltaproteobacteria bacterium]|nr:5'/3'-nucleotidase SurE [Deltaproteobacteria bacterium]